MASLLIQRVLTARHFCTLMVGAVTKAGNRRDVRCDIDKGKPSGHYQRHVSKETPLHREQRLPYQMDLRVCRTIPKYSTLGPTEELHAESDATPQLAERLSAAVADGSFPDAYTTHLVAQRWSLLGRFVLSLALLHRLSAL